MNKDLILVGVAAVSGVLVGFIVGLGIGKETNSKVGESVHTSVDGGVISVSIDTGEAIKQGAASYFFGDK